MTPARSSRRRGLTRTERDALSDPQTRPFPKLAYRVGRASGPLHFVEINALDAELSNGGYRFDVLGGGVMYCATERIGALKESLAVFRPAASSRGYEQLPGEHLMTVGSVPASWRHSRVMASFSLTDPLPFLDIEKDETLSHLTEQLGPELDRLGYPHLDSSSVRGPNRLLTRLIATWAYTQVDENDEVVYSGIRYSSRFESHECWAVFNGIEIDTLSTTAIGPDDPDLPRVGRDFDITIH